MKKIIYNNPDLKALAYLLRGINDKLLRLAIQNQHFQARLEKKSTHLKFN